MKHFLLVLIYIVTFGFLHGQNPVTVQIMVLPPYSSHIDDYTLYENKMVLILTAKPNQSMEPYQVYFKGFLQGDNGVRVETDENYKPQTPVEIPAGGSVSFQGSEMDFFSSEHMTITGANARNIVLSDGLPEGYYHICIRAFDYDTDQALSAEEPIGCSHDFGIFHINPPQILFPQCDETIFPSESQNIAFTWTIPVNSPISTEYILTITELYDGQSPDDAAEGLSNPPFFEVRTNVSSYIYSIADPQLEKGKTYVVQVRAFDPEEKVTFKNDGYSEVCTFKYGNKFILVDDNNFNLIDTSSKVFSTDTILKPKIEVPLPLISTKICGKIQYDYPNENSIEKYPMNTATVKLIVDYALGDPNGNYSQDIDDLDYGTGIPAGYVLATTTTAKDGSYCFNYLSNIEIGHIGEYTPPGVKMFSPLPLYRVLRVEIESPHTDFYEKISKNSKIVTFGDIKENVDFLFNIKEFQLNVNLKWDDFWVKLFKADFLYATGGLSGVPVYILRKKHISLSGTSPFPKKDGFPKEYENKSVYIDIPNNLELIANTNTTNDGIAKFKNLVLNFNPSFQYYIFVTPSNTTSFKAYGPVALDLLSMYNEQNTQFLGVLDNPIAFDKTISLEHEFPKIKVAIVDEDNNHNPIEGVRLTLDEKYIASNNHFLKRQKHPENIYERELEQMINSGECPCGKSIYRFDLWGTPADGTHEFNNLAILHSETNIIGNIVTIKAEKAGYELAEQDGRFNAFTLVTDKAMRMGEKKDLIIYMKRGSRVRGKIVDAETNENIFGAKITIIPTGESITTDFNGEFKHYPALKLPEKEQLLLVEKANYMLDTFKVVINKSTQDLGILKIYKLKRRLAVRVVDDITNKSINNALVTIKDVKVPCFFVNPNGCPLQERTKGIGMAFFSFDNSNEYHEILINVPDGLNNYQSQSISIKIPFSKTNTKLLVRLKPATCIKGNIYAGKTDNIPVGDAIIKVKNTSSSSENALINLFFNNSQDSTSALSNEQGYYFKRSIPLSLFQQTYIAAKANSQYIGDKWKVILNEPRDTNNCIVHDFHLTVYDDMDITHLMGFPIYITNLKSISNKKAEIEGGFVNINGNDQFAINKNIQLDFGKIIIKAGEMKPGDTLPPPIPLVLPILTDKNIVDIVAEKVNAKLRNKNGIGVSSKTQGANKGVIKGMVKVNTKFINDNHVKLPEIFITDKNKESFITVFSADKNETKPLNSDDGLLVSDGNGNNIKFEINNFHNAEAVISNSKLKNNKLILNTILHTNIESITPKDIKLNIGNLEFGLSSTPINLGSKPISVKLDKWNLNSSDWSFSSNGLMLKKGNINAKGFQLQFDNIKLKENLLDGSLAKFNFKDVKLLGIKKLNIVSNDAGFSNVNVNGDNKAYQIDIKKNDGYGYCAYIDNMPGLKPEDKISFPSILLRSDGNSLYPISSTPIKIYDLVSFRPDANSLLEVTSSLFQLHGKLILNYPDINTIATNVSFQNENNQLKFGLNATHPINFTTNNLVTRLSNITLKHHLLKATGTVEEPGAFPSTKVILTHTPEKVQIDIKENEVNQISSTNYFAKTVGEMHIDGDKWSTFWFEGYPSGMKGISDNNPKKMKFSVNGVVTASGQSIDVKKVKTPFGDMSFTYNLPKSELIGNCALDMKIGGMGVKGDVESLVGSDGWYFKAGGTILVPNFGEMSLFGLFGDYVGSVTLPPSSGGFSCLPPPFQNKVNGFILAGSIQRNFFDPINYDFKLVSVKAGLNVGLAARFYTSFEEQGSLFGLNIKLYGNAYYIGSLETTCTSVGVNAQAMLGIGSTYNSATKYFTIDGCAGMSLTLFGEQCLGAMGVCSDGCVGVNIGTLSLSSRMTGDSNGGLNYSLQKKYCSDCD